MNGKSETAAMLISRMLASAQSESQAMKTVSDKHISERTIKNAKKIWYWVV
jgi:hypothetical protein